MMVLIFGGSGFIGTHLVNTLNHQGCNKIYNLDIVENNHFGKSKFIYCDVTTPINFEIRSTSEVIIFNLAAIHRTPGHTDQEYFETNIRGAYEICEFAERNGITNIMFASSIAPYGASEDEKTEETTPMPNSPYGISKLTAEYIHRNWQAADFNKRKLQIIRPGVVFGLGENGNFTRLYNSLKNGTFFYPGRKDTMKGCIYVKDLVDLVLQIDKSFNNGIKLYNFSYQPSPSIKEIVETICSVTGIKPPRIVINGAILKFIARILKILGSRKLGIHPDRVRKLMVSTNISGKKVENDGFLYRYGLEKGIEDWYNSCNQKGLF